MELIPGSETSTHLIQTPGIYPKENTLLITALCILNNLQNNTLLVHARSDFRMHLGEGKQVTWKMLILFELQMFYVSGM
jgi:hypothetical protein